MQTVHSFSSFSVRDANESQKFYAGTLGLDAKLDEEMGILRIQLPGGGQTMLYPKGDNHQAANFTVLNLLVTDIEASVNELTGKGIAFQQYDNEYIKTDEKGIARDDSGKDAPAIAWFTDPDGNILSIIEDDQSKS